MKVIFSGLFIFLILYTISVYPQLGQYDNHDCANLLTHISKFNGTYFYSINFSAKDRLNSSNISNNLIPNSCMSRVTPAQCIIYGVFQTDLTIGDTPWGNGTYNVINTGRRFWIRATGYVDKFAIYLVDTSITHFNIMIWRRNDNFTVNLVARSEELKGIRGTLNKLDTFTLSNPLSVHEGDLVGLECSATCNWTKRYKTPGISDTFDSSRIRTYYITDTINHNYFTDTSHYYVIPIALFENTSPVIISMGNSISGGWWDGCGNYWDTGIDTTNKKVAYANVIESYSGIPIMKNGQTGDLILWQNNSMNLRLTNYSPNILTLEGGLNDIRVGLTADTICRYAYKSILDTCNKYGIDFYIVGITPTSPVSCAMTSKIDSVNNYLARNYPNNWLNVPYYLGHNPSPDSCLTNQPVWLDSAYLGDGIHINKFAHRRIADLILQKMRLKYIIPNDTASWYVYSHTQTDSTYKYLFPLYITGTAQSYFGFYTQMKWKRGKNGVYSGFLHVNTITNTKFGVLWSPDTSSFNNGDTLYYMINCYNSRINISNEYHCVIKAPLYDYYTYELFKRYSIQPDLIHKACIDTLIRTLVSNGIWAKGDVFYIFSTNDSTDSKLNVIQDSYNAVTAGQLSWNQYKGWHGKGTTSYINSNFNPVTAINPHYSRDSVSVCLCVNTTSKNAEAVEIGEQNGDGSQSAYIITDAGGTSFFKANNREYLSKTSSSALGVWGEIRFSSDSVFVYKNDSLWVSGLLTSNAVNSQPFYICALNSNGTASNWSDREVSLVWLGGKLTTAQMLLLQNAFNHYMTSLIWINNVPNDIPDVFSLEQNYPNPFNPNTNIKYQIAKNSFVKLIVYDILGREVRTLINENQIPGTYSIEWDANNYSSGIYFYRLTTEYFTKTRKMILLK